MLRALALAALLAVPAHAQEAKPDATQQRIDNLEQQNRELIRQNQELSKQGLDLLARLNAQTQKPPLTDAEQRAQAVELFRIAFDAGLTSPAAEACRTAKGPKGERFLAVLVIEWKASAACLFTLPKRERDDR